MPEQIMFEVSAEDRPLVEEALKAHPNEVEVIESKNLTGLEIFLLILKFGPGIVNAGISIYNLFRKKDKGITIVLPGGQRIENPTQEQVEQLLKNTEKKEGSA